MNMKDMLSKLNKIDSKQPLNEEVVNGAPVVEQPKTQVAEDIALNADGEDAMHLILKLAGLPTDDAPSSDLGAPSLDIAPAPISSPMSIEPVDSMRSSIDSMDALSGPADDLGGDDLSPMDVLGSDLDADMDSDLDADIDAELGEFANTPAGSSGPKTLGMDAATPSGNDLHRSKGMHKHSYQQGDNPLAMEELNKLEGKLKKMFESMSAEAPTDVKKKSKLIEDEDDGIEPTTRPRRIVPQAIAAQFSSTVFGNPFMANPRIAVAVSTQQRVVPKYTGDKAMYIAKGINIHGGSEIAAGTTQDEAVSNVIAVLNGGPANTATNTDTFTSAEVHTNYNFVRHFGKIYPARFKFVGNMASKLRLLMTTPDVAATKTGYKNPVYQDVPPGRLPIFSIKRDEMNAYGLRANTRYFVDYLGEKDGVHIFDVIYQDEVPFVNGRGKAHELGQPGIRIDVARPEQAAEGLKMNDYGHLKSKKNNDDEADLDDRYDANGRPSRNGAYDAGGHYFADKDVEPEVKIKETAKTRR